MNIYILDSEKLVKYQLPTKVEEDYSISYTLCGDIGLGFVWHHRARE